MLNISDHSRYLKRIVENYPNGDRAPEARFLLDRIAAKAKNKQ